MSLKPAAIPLMDSGKALARSGELLIELTKAMDCYGGGLSSAGAELRNAGDSIAQAAASARFKTGRELVIDELRESGNCLRAASQKLVRAAEEARQDEQEQLAINLGTIYVCKKFEAAPFHRSEYTQPCGISPIIRNHDPAI